MSKSPPWNPSNSLYSLQEDNMVDHRGHLIAKCSMNPHSPEITMSSVGLAAYTAIDITANNNSSKVSG